MSTAPIPACLTPRTAQIASLIAQGMKTKEIAAALFLSPATVAAHVRRLRQQTGASTRAEAVATAIAQGLVLPLGNGEAALGRLVGLINQVWDGAGELPADDQAWLVQHNNAAMRRAGIIR